MRKLTLRGYLEQYIPTLSDLKTLDVALLAHEAITDSPRLKEPLLLYAVFMGKEKKLLRVLTETKFKEELNVLMQIGSERLENVLLVLAGNGVLPDSYGKLYRSFVSARDRKLHDKHSVGLMWQKIVKLKECKKISNYRIYKELDLNPGNLNRFLKHGDTQAVSLETARSVLRFMESSASK